MHGLVGLLQHSSLDYESKQNSYEFKNSEKTTSKYIQFKMSVTEDERGFTKSEMQVMDPRQANFQETVNLVERNTCPGKNYLERSLGQTHFKMITKITKTF